MFITALEWQHRLSPSATPAPQIYRKSKGKSLVQLQFLKLFFCNINYVITSTSNVLVMLNCLKHFFFFFKFAF